MKKKPVAGRGKIGELVVLLLQDGVKGFHAEFAAPHLHHGADQTAHHSAEEPVGPDAIDKALPVLFPGAVVDGAVEGLYLAVALGKSGKIPVSGDEFSGGL